MPRKHDILRMIFIRSVTYQSISNLIKSNHQGQHSCWFLGYYHGVSCVPGFTVLWCPFEPRVIVAVGPWVGPSCGKVWELKWLQRLEYSQAVLHPQARWTWTSSVDSPWQGRAPSEPDPLQDTCEGLRHRLLYSSTRNWLNLHSTTYKTWLSWSIWL